MVSIRVLRNKFTKGEKVLCYEPDPAKTKVLYDSKVLDIVYRKDENGKKILVLLIHFQGWNHTWDRFVTEDYVLKDTEENRKLQRELAEKAQLTAGCGNLYRKERKKRGTSGSASGSGGTGRGGRDWSSRSSVGGVESGSGSRGSSGASGEGTSGAAVASASSRRSLGLGVIEERSDDDLPRLIVNFNVTPKMRALLETDVARIKQQNKVVKLPCNPNAMDVLQQWLTEYILSRIRLMCHKKGQQVKPVPQNKTTITIEHILNHANLCHEVADGLRVYMDFMLKNVLLYEEEKIQYNCYVPSEEACKIKVEDEKMEVDEKKYDREIDHQLRTPFNKEKASLKHLKDKLQKDLNIFKDKQMKESPAKERIQKELIIKDRTSKENLKDKSVKDKIQSDDLNKKESIIADPGSTPPRNDYDRRKSLRPRGQTGDALTSGVLPPQVSPAVAPPVKSSTTSMPAPCQTNVVSDKRAALRGKTRSSVGRGASLHGAIDITELFGPEANKGSEPLLLRPMSKREKELLKKIADRKLLPESYCEVLKPSSIYGAVHLARSLLKMPDLLAAAEYGDAKVNLLIEFMKHFMQFLEDHQEWFGEEVYIPNNFTADLIPQMQEEQIRRVRSLLLMKSLPSQKLVVQSQSTLSGHHNLPTTIKIETTRIDD